MARKRLPVSAGPIVAVLALGMAFASGEPAWADTFPGIGVGAIPDRGPGGCGQPAGPDLVITFEVSGLTAPVADVDVAMTMTHPWVGDVSATLLPPSGFGHLLFARTGATTEAGCGDSSNLDGTYTFDDSATGSNWWVEAATRSDGQVMKPREYRTTSGGGAGQIDPAPDTDFNIFNGIPAAEANGTWTLRVDDVGHLFVGSVTAASLGINEDCGGFLGIGGGGPITTTERFANCGEIWVQNMVVGPGGDLTLTSGTSVVLAQTFTVEEGGTLTVAVNPALNPLLLALEYSALLGELERIEAGQ